MGVVILVLISLLWGSSFLAIKVAAGVFGALDIATGRLVVAALCLAVVAVVSRARVPADAGVWGRLLALSLVGQMAPFFLLGLSGRLTNSSNMALMMAAVPLITFVAGRLFRDGDRWTVRGWLGLGMGFLGVMVALGSPLPMAEAVPGDEMADWLGKGAAVLAAVGYALGTLISRSLAGRVGLTATVASTMGLSATLMGLLWLAVTGPAVLAGPLSLPDAPAVVALVLLGVANTAGAYFVYFWLIRREGATFASLNNYLVPIVGVFLGAAILGESIQPQAVAGLALTLLGIIVVRFRVRIPIFSRRLRPPMSSVR